MSPLARERHCQRESSSGRGTLSGPVGGVAGGRRLQSGRPTVGTGSERPRPLKQKDRGV